MAALMGNNECVRVLLEPKADIHATMAGGFTKLHCTAQRRMTMSKSSRCCSSTEQMSIYETVFEQCRYTMRQRSKSSSLCASCSRTTQQQTTTPLLLWSCCIMVHVLTKEMTPSGRLFFWRYEMGE